MATKKPSSAKKSAARIGPVPPYGVAIREAVARGDGAEMRKVAAAARKHLSTVQTALDKLNAAMAKKA
jgi:Domain of unknown function (DUF1843)